ncbi:MAG: prolyl aminopeptidase [Pseudomonadota bacterium]
MRNADTQTGVTRRLYPVIQPYHYEMLEVADGHTLYLEECGNKDGVPVIILHGGPGGGCSPSMRRFFHPGLYRIILFDQRGCGRSRPHASVTNNTTWDLIEDIEVIRKHLGIESLIVFGGSWGATLSLLYAQAYPDHVRQLVLRGVFTMTQAELDWFYAGGAAQFFPDLWQRFIEMLPENERKDAISGYNKRLFSPNEEVQTKFARAWTAWESALATLEGASHIGSTPAAYARAFARIENHYFINHGFLPEDGYIMANMHKISHIPGVIVQGRYDMICPPKTAFQLHEVWPSSRLIIAPASGHSLSEQGISSALLGVMDEMA